MKKVLLLLVSAFSILNSQFSIVKAQGWKELMDSTDFYKDKQELTTALNWAYKTLLQTGKELGKLDSNYSNALNRLGTIYKLMGNYDSSLFYFNLSLKTIKSVFKDDNADVAFTLNEVASVHQHKDNLQEAEKYFKEGLAMYSRLYKGDNLNIANNLNNLATVYFAKGMVREADSMFSLCIGMKRRLYKDGHQDLIISMLNYARLQQHLNNIRAAENLILEALEISKKMHKEDHQDIVFCLNIISTFYREAGKNELAEKYTREALNMNKKLYPGNHPSTATSLQNLALIYSSQGRYDESESFFKESLEMKRKIYPEDNFEIGNVLFLLGNLYKIQGRLQEAEQALNQTLNISKKYFKGDHPNLLAIGLNLADICKRLGRTAEAEQLMRDCLEMCKRIYKADHPDLAINLCNLAELLFDKGKTDEALPMMIQSLDMSRRMYKGDSPNLAAVINSLAYFYLRLDSLDKAEKLYLESNEMYKRINKGNHADVAASMYNLAFLYLIQSRYEESDKIYNLALEMTKKLFPGANDMTSLLYFDIAILKFSQNKMSEAEQNFKNSLDISKINYSRNSTNLSEKEKEQYWSTMSRNFEVFLSFAFLRMKDKPEIYGYTFDNLLFTKAILFNASKKIKKRILASNDSVLISNYKDFISIKEKLAKYYAFTQPEIDRLGINIDSLEKKANDTEKELSLKSEFYKQSYEKKKVTWRTIQSLLKPDEAAIEIVRFKRYNRFKTLDTTYYAALIISDQTTDYPVAVLMDNGVEIEEKFFKHYRNLIKNKKEDDVSFKIFWEKIYDKTKEYKKIYLSPDGIYNKINIETLKLPNGKFLLDEQEIHVINSTQDLLLGYYSKQKETNIYNDAILIGNPDFSLSQEKVTDKEREIKKNDKEEERGFFSGKGIELGYLPGTEIEVNNIAKYLKSKKWVVKTFTKDNAVKMALKTADNPRVLHIATHGLFLSDIKPSGSDFLGIPGEHLVKNPLLRSGLFFAGASNALKPDFNPTGNDNGFLSAYEAMNLDLDKTELVVLSACETGLGEIKNGEGVYSLQRAFQLAGAKTVLMSLWTINDEATQELMTYFYENWISGKTKREAFSYAQLKMKEKYKFPYYWGAFVMVGE